MHMAASSGHRKSKVVCQSSSGRLPHGTVDDTRCRLVPRKGNLHAMMTGEDRTGSRRGEELPKQRSMGAGFRIRSCIQQ
jgi:hypothetical protein